MAALYAAHAPAAARFAYLLTGDKELAEDITQEAFAKILGRFGDLRSDDAFRSYLRTTVMNLARGHFRKLRIERAWHSGERAEVRDAAVRQPDLEQRDDMWSRMSRLPYRQRAALVLRFYEDLSESQAADVLNCSTAAVKSLVARAMETMRAQTWRQEG
jgi:RNA polymerase sigma factor (sigma-70 family)